MNSFKTSRACALIWRNLVFVTSIVTPAAPVISRQPSPATNSVSIGASATNQITASTPNPPLTYQWLLNGVALPDANKPILVLTSIQVTNAGEYRVQVSDSAGSVESNPWVVNVDPTFTKMQNDPSTTAGRSGAVSWIDQNGDGFPDILISAGSTGLRQV